MSNYISRQAAIEAIMRSVELDNAYELKLQQIKDIHAIPAADVVEVVRCKDCRYWKELLPVCERIHRAGWGVNDYCSFGERKYE